MFRKASAARNSRASFGAWPGQGRTAEEIAEELAKYPNGIGAKYAGRLPAEVKRSFGKWQRTQQASATGATGGTSTMSTAARSAPWPQIYVKAGEIPRVVAEAEKALIQLGRDEPEHEVYQRGGLMVRPALTKFEASNKREAQGWQLVPMTPRYLVHALTCAAQFWRYNMRAKDWVVVDAPDTIWPRLAPSTARALEIASSRRHHAYALPAPRRLHLRDARL